MSNLNIKLNLANLKAVCRFENGESGPVECMIVPLEANHLFKGKSGVYLDLTGWELKEKKDERTHLIKQSLPKDVFKAMTEEEKRAMPILGDVSQWEHSEAEPVSDMTPQPAGSKLPF